jgi:hypothetical protein
MLDNGMAFNDMFQGFTLFVLNPTMTLVANLSAGGFPLAK